MYWYGLAFTPINFLFLCLGILLLVVASQLQIELPANGDDILPMICSSGILGQSVLVFFTIGIIAAAFSSADSALTALTTSFCVDILPAKKEVSKKTRMKVHVLMTILFVVTILIFREINNRSLIDAIYTIASYTYGPLLGLFAFGLFTKRSTKDKFVPLVCIASPLICYVLNHVVYQLTGYLFGYEILILNGMITFAGLWAMKRNRG